jgi:KDO2-lipid IV(A) lauroyltransferase
MIDHVTYLLAAAVLRMMSFIPFHLGQRIGKILGFLAYLIPLKRKAVALDNIQQSCFGKDPNLPPSQLLREVYSHFGQVVFEIPHILRLQQENLDRYLVFEGEEHLAGALKKGRGAFVLTGHFGNWELLSSALTLRVGHTAVVVRPLDFAPMDRVVSDLRTRFGTEIIHHKKGMRRILAAAKQNKAIGILLDQSVDWFQGAFVPFLGRPACTNKGLALMALKTGTPVVPAFSVRQKDGRYKVLVERELELQRSGDKIRDIEDNTALFTRIIEKHVLAHPDQWFWFHRRWKTKNYCVLPQSHPRQGNHAGFRS